MKILLLLLLIIPTEAFSKTKQGINCNIHRLYCTIIELQPLADREFAMELSNQIHRQARKHGIDPYISVAIAMQEGSLIQQNREVTEPVKVKEVCDEYKRCTTTVKTVKYISDFSVFQFHINTVKRLEIDIDRLETDIEYMVEQHMMFLKKKINICSDIFPETAWACWHSATPKRHKDYVQKVMKYYRGQK